jgi:arginyl-tRNA synthetase
MYNRAILMKEKIENLIKDALKNLGIPASTQGWKEEINFSVEHPEEFINGDYSTNVAMVYAKQQKSNPKELAKKIIEEIKKNKFEDIEKIDTAGPGFINFYLSREFFTKSIDEILKQGENWGKNKILEGKKVMVEYTQPNPFKPFHIGHLMNNAIGESISRIVEFSGAKTIRANYQGDVGPHVAKAIFAILHSKEYLEVGLPNINDLTSFSQTANWIGKCYAEGSNLYDTDENATIKIDQINKKIYEKSDDQINKIYEWGREISLRAFEEIYKKLDTKFDYYFFESEMAPIGEKIVKDNLEESDPNKKIFEISRNTPKQIASGAIIFQGNKYDSKLHTRVFITHKGLPTYETKEIGLTITKFKKENPDLSIVTTATEQAEYMKVVQKAISLMYPDLSRKMVHITHGMMRFLNEKMSSRKGNVISGESLLRDSMEMIYEKMMNRSFNEEEEKEISEKVGVSALKYSILKSSLGSDIIYDFEKSISFEGDSGPYLQYTAVRASSILRKAKELKLPTINDQTARMQGGSIINGRKEIKSLERIIYQFPEIVEKSYLNLEPHHIATYLTKLASEFNSFYNTTSILKEGNENIIYQLDLVEAFYQTMQNGLWLLGIKIPEKM